MALSSLLRAGVAPVGVPFASELGGLLEELEGLEGLTPIRSHCCGRGVPFSHCCGLVVALMNKHNKPWLLIRGYLPNSHNLILTVNGTPQLL